MHPAHPAIALTAAAIAALGAGCDSRSVGGAAATKNGAGSHSPSVVIVHDDGRLPPECSVSRTASRVNAFVDAFNGGDGRRLDALIADRRSFQWFSTTEAGARGKRSYTGTGMSSSLSASSEDQRPALLRHLASRHSQAERWRLIEVLVSDIPPRGWFPNVADEVAGVDYTIRRDARDFAALGGGNRIGSGKGAIRCSDGRVLAWSMSLDAKRRPRRTARLCPAPRGQAASTRSAVIACTARHPRAR